MHIKWREGSKLLSTNRPEPNKEESEKHEVVERFCWLIVVAVSSLVASHRDFIFALLALLSRDGSSYGSHSKVDEIFRLLF